MIDQPLRLTPLARSRRILALEFIRRYFRQFGCSPSFGEIAAALDIPQPRVGAIVRELVRQGAITHTAGQRRSIVLPMPLDNQSDTDVLLEAQRRGFIVNPAGDPFTVLGGVSNLSLHNLRAMNDAAWARDRSSAAACKDHGHGEGEAEPGEAAEAGDRGE